MSTVANIRLYPQDLGSYGQGGLLNVYVYGSRFGNVRSPFLLGSSIDQTPTWGTPQLFPISFEYRADWIYTIIHRYHSHGAFGLLDCGIQASGSEPDATYLTYTSTTGVTFQSTGVGVDYPIRCDFLDGDSNVIYSTPGVPSVVWQYSSTTNYIGTQIQRTVGDEYPIQLTSPANNSTGDYNLVFTDTAAETDTFRFALRYTEPSVTEQIKGITTSSSYGVERQISYNLDTFGVIAAFQAAGVPSFTWSPYSFTINNVTYSFDDYVEEPEYRTIFLTYVPIPVYPTDDAVDVDDWPLTFEWTCGGDPDEYRLYLQQDSGLATDLGDFDSELRAVLTRPEDGTTPTTWQAPTNLGDAFLKWPQAFTSYNWKVVAVWYVDGEETTSEDLPIVAADQWTYRTPAYGGAGIYGLNLPINPTPADDAASVGVGTSSLTWEDGGGATTFDVYFDTRDNYIASGGTLGSLISDVAVASPSALIDNQDLLYSTAYVWRVNPKNAWFTREGTLWEFTALTVGSGTGVPFPAGGGGIYALKLIAAADDTIWYEV